MTGTLLHLAARAVDATLDAVTITEARARLACSTARRRVRRELGAAWFVWLVMRPRPTR